MKKKNKKTQVANKTKPATPKPKKQKLTVSVTKKKEAPTPEELKRRSDQAWRAFLALRKEQPVLGGLNKYYIYYESTGDWCSDEISVYLFSNGTCQVYTCTVYDRDSHSEGTSYGYWSTDKGEENTYKIVMNMASHDTKHGWYPTEMCDIPKPYKSKKTKQTMN